MKKINKYFRHIYCPLQNKEYVANVGETICPCCGNYIDTAISGHRIFDLEEGWIWK